MNSMSTRKIVLNGMMIALVFLATYITKFPGPIPQGYVNMGDAAVMVAALVLGPAGGFAAGAFGSALADVAAGAIIFVPITFIVKGLEGLVVGIIVAKTASAGTGLRLAVSAAAVAAGAVVMVAGYFTAEMYILSLFDGAFGYTAAAAELPANIVQGAVSAAVGYVIFMLLEKMGVRPVPGQKRVRS